MTKPRSRVAGIGMRSGAGLESLRAALELASGGAITALATIEARADALRPLAAELGLPMRVVPVAGVVTPTQSSRVQARFGTGSVAEAAAVLAAGVVRACACVLPVLFFDVAAFAVAAWCVVCACVRPRKRARERARARVF